MLPIWKNLGYIVYVVLYFSITDSVHQWPAPNWTSAIFKVLPITHIILIILSTSFEQRALTADGTKYRRTIYAGLALSLLGDVALISPDYFLPGLLLFAGAQAVYIRAFGLRPLGAGPMAASFAIVGVAAYLYVAEGLVAEDAVMRVLLVVYTVLIMTMAWRAAAKFHRERTVAAGFASVGAVLFVASDLILAVDKWRGSFDRAPFWCMVAYYAAQLAIGLSACEGEEDTTPVMAAAGGNVAVGSGKANAAEKGKGKAGADKGKAAGRKVE